MIGMLRRTLALAVVVAVPLVGLAAAPAGAKTVTPQKWAPSFCTALGNWENTIQSSATDVKSALANTSDLAGAKTTLVDFLSQAIDATDTAITDVKAAGTPATTNGAKIQAAFVKALTQAKSIFTKAEASSEQLSTDDATTFQTQASVIGTQIQSGGTEIDTGFSKVDKLDTGGKLGKVVKATKACSFLS